MFQERVMADQIDFVYTDSDSFQNEISELYSYSEEYEFFANRNSFEELMEDYGLPLSWYQMSQEQKSRALSNLLQTVDVVSRPVRLKSLRALAYLTQGNFGECLTLDEQAKSAQQNIFVLYVHGVFQVFVQMLHKEADLGWNPEPRPPAAGLSESSELRLILSVLYTFAETMYSARTTHVNDQVVLGLREQFISELQEPFGNDGVDDKGEYLVITLFRMLNDFCNGLAPHYPVKKISLLIWKTILLTLGGSDRLKNLRQLRRLNAKLAPAPCDTMDVARTLRPCSPPTVQGNNDGQPKKTLHSMRRRVFKQPAIDDPMVALQQCINNNFDMDGDNEQGDDDSTEERNEEDRSNNKDDNIDLFPCDINSEISDETTSTDDKAENSQKEDASASDLNDISKNDSLNDVTINAGPKESSTNATTKEPASEWQMEPDIVEDNQSIRSNELDRGLPWAPKVRQQDIDLHLSGIRRKFLGYTISNDRITTAGLPEPIKEGLKVLQKHLYCSLADKQLEREAELLQCPLTHEELDIETLNTPVEKLYKAILYRLPQYVIALLKILLAAAPTSKTKSESINIMSEMVPEEMPMTIIQSMKLGVDANRHKEIIIKAISAILLLLLKHFKINHIYQFEYMSQQLMFANCIPLILKFLNQEVNECITSSKSTVSAIEFPACVIGEQPEFTTETLELCSFQPYCWRNMFSFINLVRILNKLTKWKHSRIMMLVVFKSTPTLKRALSVKQATFQLYILKLIKMQAKFLGRQWRKTNMKLLSAIYQKVRHRLTGELYF